MSQNDFNPNPRWIDGECCRDYQFGNIILRGVPDTFVLRVTKFRGPYGFAGGNVVEFMTNCTIEILYNKLMRATT